MCSNEIVAFPRQNGHDVSARVSHVMKDWEAKRQEWTKTGEEATREAYEAIEKETNETENFSLPRSSKLDIIFETSDSTIALSSQANTFQTHTQYVNSEAVGST